jgi:hypothetical protein
MFPSWYQLQKVLPDTYPWLRVFRISWWYLSACFFFTIKSGSHRIVGKSVKNNPPKSSLDCTIRRAWRYQRGDQNPYIEEGQKTQWTKEKGQKDKQRSTKHTRKTKDRVTRTPLKIMGELRCSGKVSTSSNKSMTLFQPSCIYQM